MAANLVEMFKIPSDWPLPCRWSRPVNISPLGNHDSLRPQEITFSSSFHILYPFIFQLLSPASGLTFSCPFMKFSEAVTSILMFSSFLGLQYQVACTILELTVRWKDEVQMKLCLGKGDDLFTKQMTSINRFVMKDENKIVHNSNSEHFSLLPQLSIARMDPLSQVCPCFEFILHQS